ncbi:helicase, putative [Methanococcus aeolicus Nankai-3]|uniref:Helicase, putative n=1 Tax=Methanococcus aeolicus (strain ATCC BAA-1280 / DSM 17508 / OCM 812 / Nankai-3) TaxID=419665 RepID=A6UVP4_META3|nr:helicase [Methanococcus aeolicus]ABR56566.1 helicase, putative [Methanococcus aeolicus Nankai-3]
MGEDYYETLKVVYREYQRVKKHLGRKPNRVEMFKYMDDNLYQKIRSNCKINIFRNYLGFLDKFGELHGEEKEVQNIAGDFLNMVEQTRMTKTYKIPILKSFIRDNNISLKCDEEDIYKSFKEFYNNPENSLDMERHEKTKNFKKWSKWEYVKLAKENPIKFLIKTEGKYFKIDDNYFCLTEQLKPVLDNNIFVDNYIDILEFRRLEYFRWHRLL